MISIIKSKRGENDLFVLSDGKTPFAECEFSVKNAEIFDVVVYDGGEEIFAENVLRAALSTLDFAGKTIVSSKKSELRNLFSKLGFDESNGIFAIDTTKFFKPCE